MEIGAGIKVPTYVTGPASHGWWAMTVLLTVIGMIFLMALFSYLYLFGVKTPFWISAPDPLWLAVIVALNGAAAAFAWGARAVLRRDRIDKGVVTGLLLPAGLALVGGFALDWWSWEGAGLKPTDSGQGATVYALIALQGCLVFIAATMILYIAARAARGLVTRPANNTLDLTVLFVWWTAFEGAVGPALVRLFPGAI